MTRRIHRKLYKNWSPDIKTKLRRNNFGQDGLMRDCLHYNPLTYVMLDNNELIGWALVDNHYAMFFVKKRYRRQGVGAKLAKKIRRHHNEAHAYSHDAPDFFEAVGF